MHPAGITPKIPAIEQMHTYAVDHAATRIDDDDSYTKCRETAPWSGQHNCVCVCVSVCVHVHRHMEMTNDHHLCLPFQEQVRTTLQV